MKDIVFATYITSDEWKEKCAIPLMNSALYFHPEIPFEIIDFREWGLTDIAFSKSKIGLELKKRYETVVLFDADQIITSRLDELLLQDYDIAGVRNISDHGSVHMVNPDDWRIGDHVTKWQYMNAGLIAIRNLEFLNEWDTNKTREHDWEQFTLNLISYSGKYKLKILDPIESLVYYGVSNSFGNITPWDSWKTIKLNNQKLYMKNMFGIEKEIKILHKAGSGWIAPVGDKFSPNLFTEEVYSFIQEITKNR